jgi:hypothetical protein
MWALVCERGIGTWAVVCGYVCDTQGPRAHVEYAHDTHNHSHTHTHIHTHNHTRIHMRLCTPQHVCMGYA